nr:hypothetical protein [uncultured Olsenella sp.]
MSRERVCAMAPIDQETWDVEVREPIVRCRDCARWGRCPMRKGDGGGFCWQGQRREDA